MVPVAAGEEIFLDYGFPKDALQKGGVPAECVAGSLLTDGMAESARPVRLANDRAAIVAKLQAPLPSRAAMRPPLLRRRLLFLLLCFMLLCCRCCCLSYFC